MKPKLDSGLKLVFDTLMEYQRKVEELSLENETLKLNAKILDNNYDLEYIQKQIITLCFKNNPNKHISEIATMLNCNERTLYRHMNRLGLSKRMKK